MHSEASGGKSPALEGTALSFHHIAVIASDYERSKRFYTEILGFQVESETYRAERNSHRADLVLPSGDRLELFSFPTPPPRANLPEAAGLRHLAFAVSSVENTVSTLKHAGVITEPIRVDPVTQAQYTFFKDPDGLPLELYEPQH